MTGTLRRRKPSYVIADLHRQCVCQWSSRRLPILVIFKACHFLTRYWVPFSMLSTKKLCPTFRESQRILRNEEQTISQNSVRMSEEVREWEILESGKSHGNRKWKNYGNSGSCALSGHLVVVVTRIFAGTRGFACHRGESLYFRAHSISGNYAHSSSRPIPKISSPIIEFLALWPCSFSVQLKKFHSAVSTFEYFYRNSPTLCLANKWTAFNSK